MSYGINSFVICDGSKCTGCRTCEVACAVSHLDKESLTAGSLEEPLFPRLNLVKTEHITVQINCRHCEDAPCANSCPVMAIRQKNGAIVVDTDATSGTMNCIGCKTCAFACPFGAIDLVPIFKDGQPVLQSMLEDVPQGEGRMQELFTAHKCDLCIERKNQACIEACPEKALSLVNISDHRREKNIKAALSLLGSVGSFVN